MVNNPDPNRNRKYKYLSKNRSSRRRSSYVGAVVKVEVCCKSTLIVYRHNFTEDTIPDDPDKEVERNIATPTR